MKPIYLICGVPGSGKSWVCEQLLNKFNYLPHDSYMGGGYAEALRMVSRTSSVPVLADCPFAERKLRDDLGRMGIQVQPFFIIEEPSVIQKRYQDRESKPIPRQHLTRAMSIQDRADEWEAPSGTSEEILKILREIEL